MELREFARSRWNELCSDQKREIRAYVIRDEIRHIRREIHKGGNIIRRAINAEETLQSEIGRIKAEVINIGLVEICFTKEYFVKDL